MTTEETGPSQFEEEPLSPLLPTVESENELKKAARWGDIFVLVGFGMSGFMIISVGPAVAAIGAIGAAVIYGLSVIMGAFQARVISEMAVAFPKKSGGIGIYANEGFARYRRLKWVGPLSTFGYWFAWSSSMAVDLLLAGDYFKAEAIHGLDPRWFATIVLAALWIANLRGLKPGVWIGYAFGILTVVPLAILIIFSIPHIHHANLLPAVVTGKSAILSIGGLTLLLYWGFIAGYGTYSAEVGATLAPEMKNTVKDAPKAIISSALFAIPFYVLVPLCITGVVGVTAISGQPYTAFVPVLKSVLGGAATPFVVVMLIAALILAADIGTIDGSRALYQMSKDHLTLKLLGHINKRDVPSRAMSVDLLLNLALVWIFGTPLSVVVAGNIGYFLAWVFCLGAFLLLRRNRPDLPRPIKLRAIWIPITWLLLFLNIVMIVFGAPKYGWTPVLVGLLILAFSLALYAFRIYVTDRGRLDRWTGGMRGRGSEGQQAVSESKPV